MILVMIGCSKDYDNEEVVAIVGEKEITVGELRLQYNLEDRVLSDVIKDYVKEEVMVQEAKKTGMDVTNEVEELKALNNPFPNEQNQQQAEYAKENAEKLGMTEEEYYDRYIEITSQRSAYVTKLLDEKVGELDKEDADTYILKVNEYVSKVLNKYSDDIEILIR